MLVILSRIGCFRDGFGYKHPLSSIHKHYWALQCTYFTSVYNVVNTHRYLFSACEYFCFLCSVYLHLFTTRTALSMLLLFAALRASVYHVKSKCGVQSIVMMLPMMMNSSCTTKQTEFYNRPQRWCILCSSLCAHFSVLKITLKLLASIVAFAFVVLDC